MTPSPIPKKRNYLSILTTYCYNELELGYLFCEHGRTLSQLVLHGIDPCLILMQLYLHLDLLVLPALRA